MIRKIESFRNDILLLHGCFYSFLCVFISTKYDAVEVLYLYLYMAYTCCGA